MKNSTYAATTTAATAAAALIKSTAETTAVALNIQYIQRDILEIKGSLKDMIGQQDNKINGLEEKIDKVTSTVNIGIGIATSIAILFPILIKFLIK
jgi:hypothetical protein